MNWSPLTPLEGHHSGIVDVPGEALPDKHLAVVPGNNFLEMDTNICIYDNLKFHLSISHISGSSLTFLLTIFFPLGLYLIISELNED